MDISARDPLEALVPTLAAEMATEPGNHHQAVSASMLSADISGFTALSERLATRGRAGAEQLTDLINACFDALIGTAERHGGEVLKFGGDAILVLFRSPDHTLRAASAGFEMQEALAKLGPAKRANLTMTVGVHNGDFDLYLAGTKHRELLVTGRHATEVIRLESEAANGETRISPSLAAELPDELSDPLVAGDFLLLGAVPGLAPIAPPQPPVVDYRALVARNIANEQSAIDRLGGEHRVTATGFVMVQGIRASVAVRGFDGTTEAFAHLVDQIHEICDGYDVTPLHSDVADDGVKFLICAGAPLNIGSIADGLALAAREIAAIDTPFVLRQGLQLGRCFAGFLGADHRRAYSLMGDSVNTAARMIGPAGDRDVVAVEDLTAATRTVFRTDALPPLMVKGKAEPVVAHRVLGASTEIRTGRSLGPLIGREDEIEQITNTLAAGSGVVEFVGAAGLGKSRLMAFAQSAGLEAGARVYRSGSNPYATAKPYGVVADVIEKILGIEPNLDSVGRGTELRAAIAERAPDSVSDVEALAIPLDAEVPSTGLFEGSEVGFQREMVRRAIADVLTALHPEGLVLIIEDLHWIDDVSGEALAYLAQRAEEIGLIIFATRRNEGLFGFNTEVEGVSSVELQVMTDGAIREIANRSSSRALSDNELRSVVRRAAGNPLFAVEVASAIAESDGGAIPDSVESVIAGRLDRATPEARQALRVLAVWGDEFEIEAVEPLMNELAVGVDLRTADLAGIVEERSPGRWGFTHALHREVAYEGLPYKRRREFHRAIGSHLESEAADPLSIASILSVHYDLGGQHDRAWVYCREAGEQAQKRLAQVEALDAYRRALNAGRYVDVPNSELADTAIKLGDAAEQAGEYEAARWAYKKARRLVPPQDRAFLSTFRKLGTLDEREGRYTRAQRWYRRGMKAALEAEPKADRGELLLLTVAMGGAEFRRGRVQETWDLLLPLAEDKRVPAEVRLRACYLLQLSGTYLNKTEAVKFGEIGLELVDLVRDEVLHGNLVNNLGIAEYFGGRWDAAADLYEETYRLAEAAGNVLGAILALNNLGEIRSDQLRFEDAARYFDDGLRRAKAANATLAIYVLEANRGRLATRIGELDEAELLLTTALTGFTEIESPSFVYDTEIRLVELLIARGEWAESDAEAGRLLVEGAEREAGATELVPLMRIRAAAASAVGDHGRAVELLHEARRTAEEAGIRYQRAMTLTELAVLEPDAGHREAALELFGALGVDTAQLSAR